MPPIVAIGDDPADQREEQDRQLPEEIVEPEEERRLGQIEDQPGLRDLLHPVADRRGEGAEPQDAEVAVVKGGEGATDDGIERSVWRVLVARTSARRWTTPVILDKQLTDSLDPAVRARIYSRTKAKKKRNARRTRIPPPRPQARCHADDAAPGGARPAARSPRAHRRAPISMPRLAAASAAGICRKSPAPSSSGRSTVTAQALAAATERGEAVALVDTCDTFDPASAAARGVDLHAPAVGARHAATRRAR